MSDIKKMLDEKIPRDVISERDGGGGRKLSYLEGWYVIDRLNQVFGQGNWSYESDVTLIRADDLEKEKYGKKVKYHSTHYMAKVTLYYTLNPDSSKDVGRFNHSFFTDYGYGDGSDEKVPGKAHELAIKEAVTDGLKRCAKNLGMSMGLALYDKTQENVAEETEVTPTPSAVKAVKTTKTPNREIIQKSIKEYGKVINDKKVSSFEDLKSYMKTTFNVEKSEDLSDEEAGIFLTYLKNKLVNGKDTVQV